MALLRDAGWKARDKRVGRLWEREVEAEDFASRPTAIKAAIRPPVGVCKFLADLTAIPEHLTVRAEALDLA